MNDKRVLYWYRTLALERSTVDLTELRGTTARGRRPSPIARRRRLHQVGTDIRDGYQNGS